MQQSSLCRAQSSQQSLCSFERGSEEHKAAALLRGIWPEALGLSNGVLFIFSYVIFSSMVSPGVSLQSSVILPQVMDKN